MASPALLSGFILTTYSASALLGPPPGGAKSIKAKASRNEAAAWLNLGMVQLALSTIDHKDVRIKKSLPAL